MTWTALPITSALRFWPDGSLGMVRPQFIQFGLDLIKYGLEFRVQIGRGIAIVARTVPKQANLGFNPFAGFKKFFAAHPVWFGHAETL